MAVFNSWKGNKAIEYRRIERITGLKGTAVNVQAMVFGNMGNNSGTGVAFTRDPNTGENVFYGDYLINAQGEDVVAGIRTPEPISRLKEEMPKVYDQLMGIRQKLETHYKEMQDIEFTVAGRHPLHAPDPDRQADRDLGRPDRRGDGQGGLIDETTALKRVSPDSLNHLLLPQLDPKAGQAGRAGDRGQPRRGGQGHPLGRGGRRARHQGHPDDPIMLVRKETSPEDVAGMHLAKGILTATGGKASHAAVVARGWGKPCVVGCDAIQIDEKAGQSRSTARRSRPATSSRSTARPATS